MSLEREIQERSQEISTDNYSMSVGELASMYRDGELDIHPEFQRFFRWTIEQRSRLIESILLGIPIPSIFVSTKEDGTWDVVDGVQRLSTLFQLMGILRNSDGRDMAPLELSGTKYLPSLAGKSWEPEDENRSLPMSAKMAIKRARLDLKIVLNKSDRKAKYELFQRLNTGGSQASDQEVRNCMLVMVNSCFYDWLCALANDENFRLCTPLTDTQLETRFDLELIVRWLVFYALPIEAAANIGELGTFLDKAILDIAEDDSLDRASARATFSRTFELIAQMLEENAFKKYDRQKGRASGAFLISMFEVLAFGVGYYVKNDPFAVAPDRINLVHQTIWENPDFLRGSGSGVRASTRIPLTMRLGRELLAP